MEKRIRQLVDPWIERINQVFVVSAGILIVIMGFLSTYGALRRYVFNSPEPVSYEFSCMFLLISFVLANAAVEGQERLLRNDLLLDRFPAGLRNVVSNIVSPIMGLTFFGIITWISLGDALRAHEIGQVSRSAWPVPLFPIKLFVPIGYGFFCLTLLYRLVLGVLGLKTSPEETQQAVAAADVIDLPEGQGK
jgi:TRAP-type mannitol/chloroaromatic compound transport system permease small subunit